MSAATVERNTSISLGLLVTAFLALGVGNFIQFDDTSGFGSDRWSLPWGAAAALLAIAAVIVAVRRGPSRRIMGTSLIGISVVLGVMVMVVGTGFRFIWLSGEAELTLLLALIAGAGILMSLRKSPGRESGRTSFHLSSRIGLYLLGAAALTYVAFWIGISHYEATNCSDPGFDGECDVAALEGLLWAFIALVLAIIGAVVNEVRLARRG